MLYDTVQSTQYAVHGAQCKVHSARLPTRLLLHALVRAMRAHGARHGAHAAGHGAARAARVRHGQVGEHRAAGLGGVRGACGGAGSGFWVLGSGFWETPTRAAGCTPQAPVFGWGFSLF